MSDKKAAIGVFDSGIGGLTVVRELTTPVAGERLVYLGDTARTPYGNKSPGEPVRFALGNGAFFSGQGVKPLVVACNTSSAYSLPALRKKLKIPVVGVILAGARAAGRGGQRIGVIGTSATALRGLPEGHPRPGAQRQGPGPGLSPLRAPGGRRLVDG